MTDPSSVHHDAAQGRFELMVDGQTCELLYALTSNLPVQPGLMRIHHTEVPPALGGRRASPPAARRSAPPCRELAETSIHTSCNRALAGSPPSSTGPARRDPRAIALSRALVNADSIAW